MKAPLVSGVYGRVSDNRYGRSASVPQQLTAAETISRDEGWSLQYRLKGDDGVSASRFSNAQREDWDQLLELIKANKIQVLILWEPSRGSRRLSEWANFLELCRDRGVLIYVILDERAYDPRLVRDWKTLANAGVDAAAESEMTSKRVGRDKIDRAINGLPDGQCPQGYERIYDPKTKAFLEQRPTGYASVIREIFDLIEQLIPLSQIKRDFDERGILTEKGKPWPRAMLRQTAMNPVYMGKRRYKGTLYDGNWEPVIDPAQWWAVNKILTDPVRTTTRRPGRRKHLLTNWLRCAVCSRPTGSDLNQRRGREPRYRCPDGHVSARMDWVNDYVRDLVLEWVAQPDRYQKLHAPKADRVNDAASYLASLEAEMEEYYVLADARELSPKGLARMEAKYLPMIEAAKQSIQDLSTPPPLRPLLQPGTDLLCAWEEDLSVPQRFTIIKWLFASMTLEPSSEGGRGRRDSFDWARLKYAWAH